MIKDIFFELSKDFDLSISNTLDPQDAFIEQLMVDILKKKMLTYEDTIINLKIESQAIIEPHEIESIGSLLKKDYPEVQKILKNYSKLQKLF